MSDHDAEVAAVLAADLHEQFGARFYCYHEGDCPELGQTYKRCEKSAERVLAALTAAGYAVVKLPKDVEVAHGARLVPYGEAEWALYAFYPAIEPPEKEEA